MGEAIFKYIWECPVCKDRIETVHTLSEIYSD